MPDTRNPGGSGEFHRIATYFAPLAEGAEGAFGLTDDAAIVSLPAGRDQVVTADTLVEGVHFLGDEPADLLARKALRVNLSDLAAMGATPYGYLLSLSVPSRVDDAWIARFCDGLAADQSAFDWHLLGGDNTSTPGPISIAVTALGSVPAGRALRRGDARIGDAVYVSGWIGDGVLGLAAARRPLGLDGAELAALTRYQVPEPRVALGQALVGKAHAVADISDGLVADLQHICKVSGVGAKILAPEVPLSEAGTSAVANDPSLFATLLTGGDDYELVMTGGAKEIESAATATGVPVTRIGDIVTGTEVEVLDSDGATITFAQAGFRHM